MLCPDCGTQMQTLKTIPTRGAEHRWVQCLSAKCRLRVTTKEVIVPDFEFRLLDAKNAYNRRRKKVKVLPPSPVRHPPSPSPHPPVKRLKTSR